MKAEIIKCQENCLMVIYKRLFEELNSGILSNKSWYSLYKFFICKRYEGYETEGNTLEKGDFLFEWKL